MPINNNYSEEAIVEAIAIALDSVADGAADPRKDIA